MNKATEEHIKRMKRLFNRIDNTLDRADELLGNLCFDPEKKKKIKVRKVIKGFIYTKYPEGIN